MMTRGNFSCTIIVFFYLLLLSYCFTYAFHLNHVKISPSLLTSAISSSQHDYVPPTPKEQQPWSSGSGTEKKEKESKLLERVKFKNKVPFDEECYEVLKATIELFSKRVGEGKKLTMEEVRWLEGAVDFILEDARRPGQVPPRPPL
eukprot:gene5205-5735_t